MKYKPPYVIFFFLIISLSFSFCQTSESTILNIGSRLELFVDDFLIDKFEDTHLRLHHPVDQGPVLYFDQFWEGAFCGYVTVIKDKNLFRTYYRGLPEAGKDGSNLEVTCYAESTDGINWSKPDLKLFEARGSKNNNIILADASPFSHNFSPFLDQSPATKSHEKFKALAGTEKSGLVAFVSPDGIHWKKLAENPVFGKGKFDSQNVSFWSEAENSYICYFRTWTKIGYSGYRSVSRTTSLDFFHWTEPVEMDYGDTPREHIYTNQTHPYFRAAHIYIAIAARFLPGQQVLNDKEADKLKVNPNYFKDCSDAVLMTSRGENRYDRTFMEGFIRPGIGLENWVSRSNYPALNVVQTGPSEMSIYVNQNYAQPTAHLRRYSMRLDGFVSVHAPYLGGKVLTKPIIFEGKNLFLNFSTSAAGKILVEVQTANGKPVPGYSLQDSQPAIGNEINKWVKWNNNSDLSSLAGQPIRLLFKMKDADLYAIQFR
jgi:hypothetical protein